MREAESAKHLGMTLEQYRRAVAEGRISEREFFGEPTYGHVQGVSLPGVSRQESEEQFQQRVIDLAHEYGWKVVEFRKARTKHGWRTPFGADGVGFPDILLCRERIAFAELKAESGRLRPEQRDWQEWLEAAGAEWYLWRPSDIEEIKRVLQ